MRITGSALRKIIREEISRSMLNEADAKKVSQAKQLAAGLLDAAKSGKYNPEGYIANNSNRRDVSDKTMVPDLDLKFHVSSSAGMTKDGVLCVVIGTDGHRGQPLVAARGIFESQEMFKQAVKDVLQQKSLPLSIDSISTAGRYTLQVYDDAGSLVALDPSEWAEQVWVLRIH